MTDANGCQDVTTKLKIIKNEDAIGESVSGAAGVTVGAVVRVVE
jgi:hypothetical protein